MRIRCRIFLNAVDESIVQRDVTIDTEVKDEGINYPVVNARRSAKTMIEQHNYLDANKNDKEYILFDSDNACNIISTRYEIKYRYRLVHLTRHFVD